MPPNSKSNTAQEQGQVPVTFREPSYAIFDVAQNAVRTTQWGSLAIFSTRAVAQQWAAKSGAGLKIICVSIHPLTDDV